MISSEQVIQWADTYATKKERLQLSDHLAYSSWKFYKEDKDNIVFFYLSSQDREKTLNHTTQEWTLVYAEALGSTTLKGSWEKIVQPVLTWCVKFDPQFEYHILQNTFMNGTQTAPSKKLNAL